MSKPAGTTLAALGITSVVPVTYMNSAASHQGVLRPQWRHRLHIVQRAAGLRLGVRRAASASSSSRTSISAATPASQRAFPLDKMVVWDPFQPTRRQHRRSSCASAKVILWKGYCSVHARFTVEQIEHARAAHSRTCR